MMSTKTRARSRDTGFKSFADHLGELRWRIALVVLVFIVLSSSAYSIRQTLVDFVLSPIGHQKLVYLTPAGGFSFIFSVTMYAGLLATAPFAVYHVYKFIAPALPARVRRHSIKVLLASVVLMVAGAGFGYFVAIPAALLFLTNFAGGFVQPNLTADSYLNFVVAYVLGLGLMFQLPLLLVFWNWIRPFKKGELLNSQRFVLVGAFIAAALMTPTPDVLNQTMVALPIVAVYQFGVVAVYVSNRRARAVKQPATRSISAHSGLPISGVPQIPTVKTSKPSMRTVAQPATAIPPQHSQAPSHASTTHKTQAHVRAISDIVGPVPPAVSHRPRMATNHLSRQLPRVGTRSSSSRAGVDFVVGKRARSRIAPQSSAGAYYRVPTI